MADNVPRVEDVKSVGTRISWGAVLAGAVVALALYVVMTTLGAAIGLSVGRDLRVEALAGGGLVWAILTTGVALFAGGWVTSQLTAGETKCESMVHGVILWGTVFAVMLAMTAAGMRSGFNAMMNVAYAGDRITDRSGEDVDRAAKQLGFTQEQIDEARAKVKAKTEEAKDAVKNTDADSVRRGVAMTTWAALFGMLLSMGAAIGGAVVGAGPSRELLWGGKTDLTRAQTQKQYVNQT